MPGPSTPSGPILSYAAEDLPPVLPIFPLPGALLLPRARLPLNIFEPRYLAMVDGALASDRLIGMIQPREDVRGDRPKLYDVGCAGRIVQFSETGDGRYLLTLAGVCRFRVARELSVTTPYRQIEAGWADFLADLEPAEDEDKVDRQDLLASLRIYFDRFGHKADWAGLESAPAEALVNSLSAICPFSPEEKQALLEAETLPDRADMLTSLVEMAIAEDTGRPNRPLQ